MSPTEIFRSAIQKAVDNDWTMFMRVPVKHMEGASWEIIEVAKPGIAAVPVLMVTADEGRIRLFWEVEQVIFDIDFAKAIWGDHPGHVGMTDLTPEGVRNWQHHLQHMVAERDRFKYLEANL